MFFFRMVGRLLTFFTDLAPSINQDTLLRLLCIAADNGLPPAEVAVAFANDCFGRRRRRLQQFANRLTSGSTLGDAIELTPRLLPDRAITAVRFGSEMGTFSASLRVAAEEMDTATEDAVQRVTDTLVYVLTITFFATVVLSFLLIKIVPTLVAILNDFEMPTPPMTQLLIEVSAGLAEFSLLFVLLFLLLIWLVATGRVNRSLRSGWLSRVLRIENHSSTAAVLSQLAITKEAGRPLDAAISTLARHHHSPRARRSLVRTRDAIDEDQSIWNALANQGLVSRAEAEALEISTRVGNTPWVLRQMVAMRRRLAGRRLQIISQLLMPLCVTLLAFVVAFVALAIAFPIFQVTVNLA